MFNGSPQAIITLGLGTGAGFDGEIPLVLTLGLGAAEAGATLVGTWSNVIAVSGGMERIEVSGGMERIKVNA
jgi:hypothetical protein